MTRIGCCQIKPHNLLAMLPPGETISPRSKFSRPHCVDQYQCANVARRRYSEQGRMELGLCLSD
jgi:hypothetical protein